MMIAKRQLDALKQLLRIPHSRKVRAASGYLRLVAMLTVAAQLLGAFLFELPRDPDGQDLDLNRFELVWADEFNDGALDLNYWGGHYIWGQNAWYLRDSAYWHMGQVDFDEGNLILRADYQQEGPAGAGYYSVGIDTFIDHTFFPDSEGYEQTYGYFETRCVLPEGPGLNPAFWLLTDGMWADDSDGGVTGCEIDVFETNTNPQKEKRYAHSIYQTVHVDGYDENHRQEVQGHFYAVNPRKEYNTYGLEWNEDGYIFYINGVETARTDFGGVCKVPLYLIFSLGVDENIRENTKLPAEFVIDYVRAYQYRR